MKDRKFILKLLAVATNFVYEAIAAILVGYFIGLGLDYLFSLQDRFTLILMIVGALAAIVNLMKRVYRLGAKNND